MAYQRHRYWRERGGLILDPFHASFSPIQLLPIGAGFFYACNILILRHACRYESALSLVMAVAILSILSGLSWDWAFDAVSLGQRSRDTNALYHDWLAQINNSGAWHCHFLLRIEPNR